MGQEDTIIVRGRGAIRGRRSLQRLVRNYLIVTPSSGYVPGRWRARKALTDTNWKMAPGKNLLLGLLGAEGVMPLVRRRSWC